jgi:hypothetical protein
MLPAVIYARAPSEWIQSHRRSELTWRRGIQRSILHHATYDSFTYFLELVFTTPLAAFVPILTPVNTAIVVSASEPNTRSVEQPFGGYLSERGDDPSVWRWGYASHSRRYPRAVQSSARVSYALNSIISVRMLIFV